MRIPNYPNHPRQERRWSLISLLKLWRTVCFIFAATEDLLTLILRHLIAVEEETLPPSSETHTLRTIFLNDFTILSAHATALHDVEMQAVLRDVNAIGISPLSREGWSEPSIEDADIAQMCWNFFAYLRCGDGGVLPNRIGARIVSSIGAQADEGEKRKGSI